jgi:sugar/nucleoside kinase (ribokinase family)
LPTAAIPDEWRDVRGWILAPVAAELPDDWATLPPEDAIVALGWQGLLRELEAGEPVRHLKPSPHPIVRRADVVGLSGDDVERHDRLLDVYAAMRPGATLAVTQGDRGGLIADGVEGDRLRLRHYPAIRSGVAVDPTGAGDVFLAALAAARIEPRLVGGRIAQGFDVALAAATASLVVEAPGLHGVPNRDAVRRRMAEGAARRRSAGQT